MYVGFCLIRQSSASRIVCFHESNQITAAHAAQDSQGTCWLLPWINERRGGASPAAFPAGVRHGIFGFRNPGPQPVFQTMAATAGPTGAERRLLGFPCLTS